MMQLFTLRNALVAAAIGLIAAFGYETDWGDAFSAPPIPTRQTAAKHDSAAVLPDFRLSSEANAYSQITERPLLNPSRKPAPTQAPVAAATEPPKPQIRRGLYTLIGVTDLGGSMIAQVKEVSTGRVKSVREGDSLQELGVKKIEPSRITLAFRSDTDVVELPKYTASGRVPQPTVVATPAPLAPPSAAPPPIPAVSGSVAAQVDQADNSARQLEARRAARLAGSNASPLSTAGQEPIPPPPSGSGFGPRAR
jgi:hypothetical protein